MRLAALALAAALAIAACGGDDGDPPTAAPASTTSAPSTTTTAADGPPAGTALVGIDGRSFEATACTGADGAVVATIESGTVVQLVRGEAEALRILTEEGTSAETTDLVADSGTYAGTVVLEGVEIDLVLTPSTGGDPAC